MPCSKHLKPILAMAMALAVSASAQTILHVGEAALHAAYVLLVPGPGGGFDVGYCTSDQCVWLIPRLPIESSDSWSAILSDADQDGDLDAVIGAQGGAESFDNDGSGFFAAVDSLPAATFSGPIEALAAGDLNNDGYEDLVLATGSGVGCNHGCGGDYNQVYLNDGSGSYYDASDLIPAAGSQSRDVAVADVNGDGLLDIYFANDVDHTTCGGPGGCHVYARADELLINLGSSFALAPLPGAAARSQSVVMEDFDGDGDIDIFVGHVPNCEGCTGFDELYVNDGAGGFAVADGAMPEEALESVAAAAGDVDGDGDLDLLVAGAYFASNRLYINETSAGGEVTFVLSQEFPEVAFTVDVALADLNGDGALDAYFANDGLDTVYFGDGAGRFVLMTSAVPPGDSYTTGVEIGDVDGDGDPDALLTRGGQDQVYINIGNGILR